MLNTTPSNGRFSISARLATNCRLFGLSQPVAISFFRTRASGGPAKTATDDNVRAKTNTMRSQREQLLMLWPPIGRAVSKLKCNEVENWYR